MEEHKTTQETEKEEKEVKAPFETMEDFDNFFFDNNTVLKL